MGGPAMRRALHLHAMGLAFLPCDDCVALLRHGVRHSLVCSVLLTVSSGQELMLLTHGVTWRTIRSEQIYGNVW